ncbi:hypothetical protein [Blastococcus sp. TF02A-26]|uniref:hypothetical protein n=1 Tax=Blastococcus sp. TF02A-26 TaxID=2250577 RepID=UPI0011BDF208|nr:hypothetical protein [Blastococcus sp. TF02A-26]
MAEFPLGADTPVARRFPLVPAQGIHVQLLPAPATPPVPGGPEPTSPSAPTTGAGAVPTFEPSVAWADGGRHLAVVTYGSSSCPSAPYGIDVVADQEIEVRLGSRFSDRDVCTADMSGFVTVVELPSGVSPTKPLTARLAGREVTIPAADG